MNEKASFSNKITVFYVTQPPKNKNDHPYINSISLRTEKQPVRISFYTSVINIEDDNIFMKIRYAMTDTSEEMFSGFTDPVKINKVPGTTFTSFNISAEFVLEIDKIACFEVQLQKRNDDSQIEVLDFKRCFVEIKLHEGN